MLHSPTPLRLAPLALLGACALVDPTVCTDDFRHGLIVEAVQATNGAPVSGARGAVHDGAYVDSLDEYSPGIFSAAGERGGIYSVEVVHPGYVTWTKDGVWVREDECHVKTITLRAELVANP